MSDGYAERVVAALVRLSEPVSPAQFGILSARAAQAGLTISTGIRPALWIYCVFVVALAGTLMQVIITPRAAARPAASTSS